jgi:signal transduction histidine kinase
MEGFDTAWIFTEGAKHSVTYSNMEPKIYVFKVKACNSDGVWNPKPRILTIKVLTPWWKTWWFRIISLLLSLLLFFLILQYRLREYRNKQKALTILVKNRTLELEGSNELLRERQTRIEEQTEELRLTNEQLLEKQKFIQIQAEKLQDTNQQLMVLNSTKDKFFSIIAHDLRNPFHVVCGFAELLILDYKRLPFEKIEHYLGLIHKTSTYGNNLLDNLLQWSRSQSGHVSFGPAKIVLSTMVGEIIYLFEGEALAKKITIESSIDPDLTITADENMLNTILRNLLSNALKFTQKEGRISVKATLSQSFVEISVSDSGVGISPESCRLLFNIDSNISTKGTSNEGGTGIGLILCKEFVEKHLGTIWVESELNKGSTFKFTLPNV